jgi:hypothetical protein
MKFVRVLAVLSLFGALAQAQSLPERVPSLIETHFNQVYVPEGFDDNDNVQIFGVGVYPTACYRNAETTVNVDEVNKTITIVPTAFYYNGICLQVLLPFERVIDVGILKAGVYSIFQNNSQTVLGQVNVRHALQAEPDDELYAPVSQVFVRTVNGMSQITITGEMPSGCMALKEIRVDVQKDVIVLLPIVEMKIAGCKKEKYSFESTKSVSIKPGQYMMHVRSMNGKSINNRIDVL